MNFVFFLVLVAREAIPAKYKPALLPVLWHVSIQALHMIQKHSTFVFLVLFNSHPLLMTMSKANAPFGSTGEASLFGGAWKAVVATGAGMEMGAV